MPLLFDFIAVQPCELYYFCRILLSSFQTLWTVKGLCSCSWSPKSCDLRRTICLAELAICQDSSLSHLNHGVCLRVCAVLHGLPSLAGQVHRVTPPAVPRHGHVTVVREPGDPLAAPPETNIKTWGQRRTLPVTVSLGQDRSYSCFSFLKISQ